MAKIIMLYLLRYTGMMLQLLDNLNPYFVLL